MSKSNAIKAAQRKAQKAKVDAIAKLNAILRFPKTAVSGLHRVGCAGGDTFRKVVMAHQRPYVAEGEERDDKTLYYKVYTVLDGELTDLTPLIGFAIGQTPHQHYGLSEPIGTAGVSNALRRAIEKKGENFSVWVL